MVGGPGEPVWGTFSEARPRPWGFSHAVVPGRACSPGSPVLQPWASGTVLLCWASGFSAFTLRVNLFTRIHREARLDIAGRGGGGGEGWLAAGVAERTGRLPLFGPTSLPSTCPCSLFIYLNLA